MLNTQAKQGGGACDNSKKTRHFVLRYLKLHASSYRQMNKSEKVCLFDDDLLQETRSNAQPDGVSFACVCTDLVSFASVCTDLVSFASVCTYLAVRCDMLIGIECCTQFSF